MVDEAAVEKKRKGRRKEMVDRAAVVAGDEVVGVARGVGSSGALALPIQTGSKQGVSNCFLFLDPGMCMSFFCQVSFLECGPTCQKMIKWAKSPDQCILQKVY